MEDYLPFLLFAVVDERLPVEKTSELQVAWDINCYELMNLSFKINNS